MSDDLVPINGQTFAAYAADQLVLWSSLVNCRVSDNKRGEGRILDVEQRRNYIPLITLKFASAVDAVKFNSESFKNAKTILFVPQDLATNVGSWAAAKAAEVQELVEREQYKALVLEKFREERAERERNKSLVFEKFRELTEKYDVPPENLWDGEVLSPLAAILEKLERREQANDGDLNWLEHHKLFRIVAIFHYRCFKIEGDQWALIKVCKYLRKAGLPEKVVDLTNVADSPQFLDSRLQGALMTTRGGAFRDMNNLEAAKSSTNEAIRISPSSYYPYNLMGALLYQEGSPGEGDKYFEKAVALGAPVHNQEFEVRSALVRSTGEVRMRLVQHLLSKDSNKYYWVEKYAL